MTIERVRAVHMPSGFSDLCPSNGLRHDDDPTGECIYAAADPASRTVVKVSMPLSDTGQPESFP